MSIKERFAKLLDVKSIVTIFLAVIFGILTLWHVVSAEQFVDVFKTIVIFYFGTQAMKKSAETTKE